MRIRIVFKLKNKGVYLPFHHQSLIRELLEKVLGPSYPLYDKMFSFSGIKGQTKVGREGLHYYSKRITLVFSSKNEVLITDLSHALLKFPQLSLGELILEPEIIEKEEVVIQAKHASKYLCISPIVLANTDDVFKNKVFINPSENEFSDLLYESTMARMEASGDYSTEQLNSFYKFQVVPDFPYLDKIASQNKKFARIYSITQQQVPVEVRGYTLPFSLYASQEVQDFVFHNGFGEFTEHGYGLIDYIGNPLVRREVLYRQEQVSQASS